MRQADRYTGDEKLARWKRYFEEVLNVQNTLEEGAMARLEDHLHIDTPNVTREEVERAVKKLQNGKAAGDDRIVVELVESGGEAVIDWLVELIQGVWKTRQVLQEWRNATFVPLHKKKDQKEYKNYRGISLLSIPGKVLTLALLERMQIVIEPQLSEAQCGFRKGQGTVDQLWLTRQVMEKAVEYRTPVQLCFIDLTKALELVDCAAMVVILRSYGVPPQLVKIIEDLLQEAGAM